MKSKKKLSITISILLFALFGVMLYLAMSSFSPQLTISGRDTLQECEDLRNSRLDDNDVVNPCLQVDNQFLQCILDTAQDRSLSDHRRIGLWNENDLGEYFLLAYDADEICQPQEDQDDQILDLLQDCVNTQLNTDIDICQDGGDDGDGETGNMNYIFYGIGGLLLIALVIVVIMRLRK